MIPSISRIPLSLLFLISLFIQVRGQLVTRQANTPTLLFNPMGDKQACEKTYIRWAFSGEGTPMTLLLLKVGAPTSTSATPISKTLNSTLDPLTGEFEWKADVPPGRYHFNASLPALDATFQSETFDVKMVLSAKTPLSSSRSIVTSSAATSSSELLDTDATSIPSVTCPPRLSAKPRVKTSNVYVLVGVAIGANALLVETLFACFLLRKGRIAPWRLRP